MNADRLRFLGNWAAWFTSLLLAVLGTHASRGLAVESVRVKIDSTVKYQTIDGFGASDAWRCHFVGQRWPLAKRERIADLLFSQEIDPDGHPRGIGLSLWRFNIGAGTAEQGDASDIRKPWRRVECFQSADGQYDWSKQAGQQWFLRAARQRGVERYLAFANAPPVHMALNGKGYADNGRPRLNLQPSKFDDYARFLADVVEHFQEQGLPFDYLSPFNEPQWAWDEPSQEGTPANNIELYALVRCLSNELHERQLNSQLVLGEAGTIAHIAKQVDDDGRDNQARFFFATNAPFSVRELPNVAPIISAHAYHSVWPLEQQVDYRRQLCGALGDVWPELGYWQSEYCILEEPNEEMPGGPRRDLGMRTALYVARIIHHDLAIGQARSWQWWTALTQSDYKDGLVYLDDGSQGETGRMGPRVESLTSDGEVRESKLLWALGNYSRFVRPGAVRIGCSIDPDQSYKDGVLASAYHGPGGETAVVLVNLSQDEVRCEFEGVELGTVYSTTASENLAPNVPVENSISLPPRSICTCVESPARTAD